MRAPGWWSSPTFSDPAVAEQGQIAYAILRAGTLVSAGMLASAPFAEHALRSAANYGLLLALHIGHLYLLRRGQVRLAVRSFCFCYFALVTATIVQFGGIRSPAGFVYPPLVLVAGLMWSSRAAIGFAIACALSALVLVFLERAQIVQGVLVGVERIWTVMAAVLFVTATVLHVALTALRKARSEALALQIRLERAERLEALGRLAGGVAHDFNNQLTAMLAHTALLRTATDTNKHAASIKAIELAAEHAGELTRQLLEFGRRRVLEPSVIDVREAIGGLRNLLTQSLSPRTTLRTSFGHGALHVRIDRTALERVLINLILNARDAMPDGGEVVLLGRRLRGPGRDHDSVEITVRDQGIGMSEATRARIFEPFFTTKPYGRGSGLGLSSVLGVVAQSGGEVDVESAPDKGTSFRILLPAANLPVAQSELERAPRNSRGMQLLLVEDEAAIRRALQFVLADSGFSVLTAGSFGEALSKVAERDRPLDLLITDVMLPDGDGLKLLAQLRDSMPGLLAVVITGHVDTELALAYVNDRNTLLLHKPFTPQALLSALRQLAGSQPPEAASSAELTKHAT